ncbi:MAG: glycosyltransferase [Acidobacteriota bacterium]|nr:glycosyltransferase [Acidobacteriota bacterium]
MKVLHVIPAVALRYGGPSQAIYVTCRALQAQSVTPIIATTNADGGGELPVPLGSRILYQEVPTIFFARQFSEALKYSRPLAQWLSSNIKDFDLVHIHAVFSHACIAAANACRKHQVPYIVRPLGTLDPWSLKQKRLRKRLFWHLGVKQMLAHASAIHYTTAEEQRLVETTLGLTNGVVIPNGIDFSETLQYRDRQEADDYSVGAPYVLTLSRLHPKKGYELLIEAFADLKRQKGLADWQLVFAGDGEIEYVNQLKQLARQQGLNGNAHFIGWLDGERKAQVLRDASLLALPSHQENFGICLIEAMAYGVPVLVSPHVNLAPEIQAAGAGWIAQLNPESMTHTLAEALGEGHERRLRGERGRELAREFSSTEVASKLIELYRSLIQSGRGHK